MEDPGQRVGWTAAQAAGTAEHARRSSSFGADAFAYAEYRPSYPEPAVRWALEPVSGDPPDLAGLRVLDLAAGTGKLTEVVVRLGADVTVVEPDPQMLAELRRRVHGVRALAGSAEQIAAPDASFDAVVVGQALHWFDADTAMPEIARVLRAGGVLAGLWNFDDQQVPWVEGLTRLTESGRTLAWWRAGADVLISKSFVDPVSQEFDYEVRQTVESIVARTATHSNVIVLPDDERTELLERVRRYLNTRPETGSGEGEFILPMVTGVVRAVRVGAGSVSGKGS